MNTVPRPERAGGTGEGQKPMGANFITDPRSEIMGGACEYITSKCFSSLSRGPKGQPDWTGASWIQPVRHLWEVCHLAYRGAWGRCVFGVTYPLREVTWQRTIISPKRNWIYGGATEPHYLFSSKLLALRLFLFIIHSHWRGAINVGYAGFGAQAISRSRPPGEKDWAFKRVV